VASLVGGLRKRLDLLLVEKAKNPMLEMADTQEMQLIVKLIQSNGI
jgi:hypothetical protein